MSNNPSAMSSTERKKKRALLVRLYGLYCHWCQHPLTEPEVGVEPFVTPPPDGTRWATLDHVVATSQGGPKRTLSNLVLACPPCNNERSKESDPLHGVSR